MHEKVFDDFKYIYQISSTHGEKDDCVKIWREFVENWFKLSHLPTKKRRKERQTKIGLNPMPYSSRSARRAIKQTISGFLPFRRRLHFFFSHETLNQNKSCVWHQIVQENVQKKWAKSLLKLKSFFSMKQKLKYCLLTKYYLISN